MKLTLSAARGALLLSLACLAPTAARADVTYTYVGNDFSSGIQPPFTASDHITGSFVLAQPLAPGLALQAVTPLSFSYNDGIQTASSANAGVNGFQVSTDTYGNIKHWDIYIMFPQGEFISKDTSASTLDSSFENGITASNAAAPGIWSQSSVPEPSSLFAVGSGLFGLLLCRRRKPLRKPE